MQLNPKWPSDVSAEITIVNTTLDEGVYDFRRNNLLELIRDKFEGNRSSFARFVEKNVNMINLCLTANPELRRNIGERLARELEKKCSLPLGWLDEDKSPATMARSVTTIPRIGPKKTSSDLVGENFVVYDEWLRRTHPSHKSFEALALYVAHDDFMEPTIKRGDAVLVDTADDESGSGVFLLRIGHDLMIRRISPAYGDLLTITSDNTHYPPVEVEAHTMGAFIRVGRVLGVLRYTPL